MAIVLTVDQRESRDSPDLISEWLPEANTSFREDMRLEFVRTVGDEMQGMVDDPEPVVEMVMVGVRYGAWWLGIGLGEAERPLGRTAADSRGSAFYNAREAVSKAKDSPYGFAIVGDDADRTQAVSASLTLLANIASRRGPRQWDALDWMYRGLSQKEVAEKLEVTPQAVSQRLRAAGWQEEQEGRWLAEWLLAPEVESDE